MSVALLTLASILTLVALVIRIWPARRDSVARYHDAVEALGHAVDRSTRTKTVA